MTRSDTMDELFSDLMRQAQNGNTSSYEQLLLTIAPLIRSFVSRRIPKDPNIDDVVQNSLVALHNASHTYNTNRSFTGWMFAIVRYKLNDYLKTYYKKTELIDHSIDDDDIVAEYSTAHLPTSSEQLAELINELPEPQRQIVHMLKIEGYSIQEVSVRINMSESAVKVSAHRAYKLLIANAQKIRDPL